MHKMEIMPVRRTIEILFGFFVGFGFFFSEGLSSLWEDKKTGILLARNV